MNPSSRWFVNQWDRDRLAKYDRVVGIWVNEVDGSVLGEDGWEDIFKAHVQSMQRDVPIDATGVSFDDILNDVIGIDNVRIVSK
jgi:hypothetical protein